jgi:hypothetical protein
MELLREWYGRRMNAWEMDLATRSTDRVVRPFDWGIEWTRNWPVQSNAADPETRIRELNALAIAHSDEFFAYKVPNDFRFNDWWLQFTSAVDTPYAENNTVHGRFFPANPRFQRGMKAVVVLPHWNASPQQHVALCAAIAKTGIAAIRISLPYHDKRMPAELTRADYAVSSNVARTIDATRQAVIDVRSCFDWLQQQGYTELGIVGTSLGSCYAFLARTTSESRWMCLITAPRDSPMWCGPVYPRATSRRGLRTRSIWTGCARRGSALVRCITWISSQRGRGGLSFYMPRMTPRFCRSFQSRRWSRCANAG